MGENIEAVTIQVINDNLPNKIVSKSDVTAIHRMPKDNTVMCAFASKPLRNE